MPTFCLKGGMVDSLFKDDSTGGTQKEDLDGAR